MKTLPLVPVILFVFASQRVVTGQQPTATTTDNQPGFNLVVGGIDEPALDMAQQCDQLTKPGVIYRIRVHDSSLPFDGVFARMDKASETIHGTQSPVRTLEGGRVKRKLDSCRGN